MKFTNHKKSMNLLLGQQKKKILDKHRIEYYESNEIISLKPNKVGKRFVTSSKKNLPLGVFYVGE